MVMEIVHEDNGEGNMQQCINHPYRNSSPGGICALCLQEKLGKLVSSSFPVAVFPSTSSSSSAASPSPSVRSDFNTLQIHHHHHPASSSSSNSQSQANNEYNHHHDKYYTKGSKLPFVLTHKKEKKVTTTTDSTSIAFKRSKSTTASRRGGGTMHFLNDNYSQDYSPNRRGFWSFLYLSKHSTAKKSDKHYKDFNFGLTTPSSVGSTKKRQDFVVVEDEEEEVNGSPDNQTALSRKVSRSRSVGCGSRSFSGEFFERISTGFGDCALRRVESQREGKPKMHRRTNGQDCIKERVKCGGIFSGFMITSSSSSLIEGTTNNVNGKEISAVHSSMRHLSHGRSRSWGWALASPMRAFAKQSAGKREGSSSKNVTPNLAAIPSLLAVSG